MKRSTYKQVKPFTATLFSDQVEVLRSMPNASKWLRSELTKILDKPLSNYQITALRDIVDNRGIDDPTRLSTIASDLGINVTISQCREFLSYYIPKKEHKK